MMVVIAVISIAFFIGFAVVLYRSAEAFGTKDTTVGNTEDFHEISNRVLEVRKRILNSDIIESERLELAGTLLFISDDIKETAGQLAASAYIEASLMHQPRGPF